MAEKQLKKDLDFVKKHKAALLKEYADKFILVHARKLAGSYDSYEKAAEEGVRLFGVDGDFLVYHLVEKEPLNFIMEARL